MKSLRLFRGKLSKLRKEGSKKYIYKNQRKKVKFLIGNGKRYKKNKKNNDSVRPNSRKGKCQV